MLYVSRMHSLQVDSHYLSCWVIPQLMKWRPQSRLGGRVSKDEFSLSRFRLSLRAVYLKDHVHFDCLGATTLHQIIIHEMIDVFSRINLSLLRKTRMFKPAKWCTILR